DIDGARVVWCASVVFPEVVAEPAVALGHHDEVAATLVGETKGDLFAPVMDGFDAVDGFEHGAHLGDLPGILDVHMSYLVISHSEGFTGAAVEQVTSQLCSEGDVARAPER